MLAFSERAAQRADQDTPAGGWDYIVHFERVPTGHQFCFVMDGFRLSDPVGKTPGSSMRCRSGARIALGRQAPITEEYWEIRGDTEVRVKANTFDIITRTRSEHWRI